MTTITQFSPEQLKNKLPAFATMLKLTVDEGASIGWLPPIKETQAVEYWHSIAEQITADSKILIVALQGETVVGAVQLGLESRENGNHRAEVQKLMVHPAYRRQGIARQLMEKIDPTAKQANRSLLVLDVRKGDPAETLYQQMGFSHVGDIPDYARSTETQFDTTAYYYKQLS